MYIAYYDEAGDDGLKAGSSDLFVLTCLYMHHQDWKSNYLAVRDFRSNMARKWNIPIREEFHAKQFLRNIYPYNKHKLSNRDRVGIITEMCSQISSLNCRIVNVVINKTVLTPGYEVLNRAFTYSIQRVENDIRKSGQAEPFLIITDVGRVGKMKDAARKVRRYNYIPSRIMPGTAYPQEIEHLIEDPLPKESQDSYFIQLSDLVSLVVHFHMRQELELGIASISKLLAPDFDDTTARTWMDNLRGSLNLEASTDNPHGYGIVCYPRKK